MKMTQVKQVNFKSCANINILGNQKEPTILITRLLLHIIAQHVKGEHLHKEQWLYVKNICSFPSCPLQWPSGAYLGECEPQLTATFSIFESKLCHYIFSLGEFLDQWAYWLDLNSCNIMRWNLYMYSLFTRRSRHCSSSPVECTEHKPLGHYTSQTFLNSQSFPYFPVFL